MHPDTYKRPLLWTLIVLILGLCFFYKPGPGKSDVFHTISKEEVSLIGRVESFSVAKKDTHNAVIKIISVNGESASGRVYARFSDGVPLWKDTVSFVGKLKAPYGVDLPGHFDWRNYLAVQQIFTEVKSEQFTVVRPAAFFWRMVRGLRSSILRTFNQSFEQDLAGIAGGILLGERGEISKPLYTAFQDSGAIHLLVASGGNVGFVTLITLLLGSLIGLRRRPLLLLTLVTAGFYTLIAGADAPLVRAYLMAAGACAGYLLGRNSGVFQGLLIACFVLICVRPSCIFETGFQMSFLATLAIILCLTNYRPPEKWPRWVQFFARIFLATLASQLALLPIFINVFYKVSLTGLVSNMVLVPLASAMMAVSFLFYLFSLLHAGIIFYYPCLWGLTLFKFLVESFAAFQFSSIATTAWNGGSVAAYYSLLFVVFNLPQKKFARKIALPCILFSVFAFLGGYFYTSKNRVYLLSEWNHRAAVVRVKKNVLVFNSGMPQEKLTRALAALGEKSPAAVFSLIYEKTKTEGMYQPFEMIWPDETVAFGKASVRAAWEIHRTKDGRVWSNPGYSGSKKEGISYCVTARKDTLCVGEHARFVQINDAQIIEGKTNETVSARW